MAAKTFCPIMTIGFDPPGQGKRDNRLCMKDCTWYNVAEETCNLNVIAESIQSIEMHTSDVSDYTADIAMANNIGDDYNEPFELDEETRDYYSRFSQTT